MYNKGGGAKLKVRVTLTPAFLYDASLVQWPHKLCDDQGEITTEAHS